MGNTNSSTANTNTSACPHYNKEKENEKEACPYQSSSSTSQLPLDPRTCMPTEQDLITLQQQNQKLSSNNSTTTNNIPTPEIPLSKDRESSTIPRTDAVQAGQPETSTTSTWTYPSQLMFYNALARKGKAVHAQDIDSMLAIHNSLNESVWQEIVDIEKRLHPECDCLSLTRFRGRPDDLSPLARWHMWWNGADKPFDRHDWVVDRCGKEVRYVIDYYGAPSQAEGVPVFSVLARPALDSFESIYDRMKMLLQ